MDGDEGARRVRRVSVLPLPADQVWALMLRPDTMLYVLRGLLDFPVLKGRREPICQGESGTGWVRLFHLVPLARWSIDVRTVNAVTKTISTEERGGVFRWWAHTLHAEPAGDGSCRYSDVVELNARPLTAIAAPIVEAIFWYRHRRWRRLAAVSQSVSQKR
jgi:hypothetical protein